MRRIRILLWMVLAVASARLLWIGWNRQNSLQPSDRSVQNRYNAPDLGRGLKITHFYARSGEIVNGEQGLICYGVRDADRVSLDPPVEAVEPVLTRCFFVEPHEDTTYTLRAEDAAGQSVSESFRLRVKPAPPEIRMLASEPKIQKGDAATMCYRVEHARTVRLEPIGWQLTPSKNCVRFYPAMTMTYTLVAFGDAGGTDRRSFRVAVQ